MQAVKAVALEKQGQSKSAQAESVLVLPQEAET